MHGKPYYNLAKASLSITDFGLIQFRCRIFAFDDSKRMRGSIQFRRACISAAHAIIHLRQSFQAGLERGYEKTQKIPAAENPQDSSRESPSVYSCV